MQAIDTPWARGTVAVGLEPVAAAFAHAPRAGTALGAACTIIHRGETVVDMQGGFRDESRAHGIVARKLA
ncbi:MAG: hypothetical protein VX247_07760 [Pseudomonadota bacterium]|nr:hypothetical protein [Pseudomonadota bacterium]